MYKRKNNLLGVNLVAESPHKTQFGDSAEGVEVVKVTLNIQYNAKPWTNIKTLTRALQLVRT